MDGYEDEFIASCSHSYPAGEGEVFVRDCSKGMFHLVPEPLFQVLRLADRFRSLNAHREGLIEAGWQDDGSGHIEKMFEELVQRGLLRSKSNFLEALAESSAPAGETPRIGSLCWITRDRPEMLKRSVEGFIDNCQEHDRTVEYRIFDDSPDEGTRCQNRQLLADLARLKGARILYAGEQEKRAFTEKILGRARSAGLPEEVVEFALFDPFDVGFTAGANSNCFLLGTTGELALMIDDDALSSFHRSPAPSEGVVLDFTPDPTRFAFFPSRTELLEGVDTHDLPILEAHEQLLGRSLPECIGSASRPWNVDVSRVSPEDIRSLDTDSCSVAVTMSGVYGDSGMGSPRMLLGLTGESRRTLMSTEQHYRSSTTSREVLRVVDRPTIGRGGLLMTMNCGFDNRDLLPPFFPVMRGSDGLFSQTLGACQTESLIGYLPIACYHDPAEGRAYHPDELRSSSIRMIDLLMLIVRDYRSFPRPGQREKNLKNLGYHLRRLGELDDSLFRKEVATLLVAEMSRHIQYLENLLVLHDHQPHYWAKDVAGQIESIKRRITYAELTPDDLSDRPGPVNPAQLCQELVSAFGKLLCWWPLIRETARSLKSEGSVMYELL